jgi:hypothetical protein
MKRGTVRAAAWIVASGCVAGMLSACASSVPPSRLDQYIGPSIQGQPVSRHLPEQRPLRAGMVILTDTTAPDAAPPPPEEAVNWAAEALQEEISSMLPISIEKIISPESVERGGDVSQFQELGRKHGVDHLLVSVISSTEKEYPISVFLGWTSHMQPGLRRDNWTLVEVALIDVRSGRVLLNAEARGWATLDRPTAPGINQWYPVVWLRPQDPSRRYWPPTYAGAPNTLRVIALQEALRRVVSNLQDAWIQQRETELQQARG